MNFLITLVFLIYILTKSRHYGRSV